MNKEIYNGPELLCAESYKDFSIVVYFLCFFLKWTFRIMISIEYVLVKYKLK